MSRSVCGHFVPTLHLYTCGLFRRSLVSLWMKCVHLAKHTQNSRKVSYQRFPARQAGRKAVRGEEERQVHTGRETKLMMRGVKAARVRERHSKSFMMHTCTRERLRKETAQWFRDTVCSLCVCASNRSQRPQRAPWISIGSISPMSE